MASVCITVPPAVAQRTTFTPSLFAGVRGTDNLRIGGEEGGVADQSVAAGINLNLTRAQKKGNLQLTYLGLYEAFRTFDVLDHAEHKLNFGFSRLAHGRALLLTVDYRDDQSQGDPVSRQDDDFFVSDRRNIRRLDVGVDYEQPFTKRWNWGLGVKAYRAESENVIPPGLQRMDTENRNYYEGRFTVNYGIGPRSRVGVTYRAARVVVENNEDVHAVTIDGTYDFTRRMSLAYTVGGYSRTNDDPTADIVENGVVVTFDLRFNEGLTLGPVRFDFEAGVSPSGGGQLVGTSTNAVAAVILSGVQEEPWRWLLATRYAYRFPSDRTLDEVGTFSVGGEVERSLGRKAGVRLRAYSFDQTSTGSTFGSGSFYEATLAAVWYPKGRTGPGPEGLGM